MEDYKERPVALGSTDQEYSNFRLDCHLGRNNTFFYSIPTAVIPPMIL